jgi:hypothetical protein
VAANHDNALGPGPSPYIPGLALQRSEYLMKALRYYEKALKVDPRNIYAANGAGAIMAERGYTNEAREIFVQVQYTYVARCSGHKGQPPGLLKGHVWDGWLCVTRCSGVRLIIFPIDQPGAGGDGGGPRRIGQPRPRVHAAGPIRERHQNGA